MSAGLLEPDLTALQGERIDSGAAGHYRNHKGQQRM